MVNQRYYSPRGSSSIASGGTGQPSDFGGIPMPGGHFDTTVDENGRYADEQTRALLEPLRKAVMERISTARDKEISTKAALSAAEKSSQLAEFKTYSEAYSNALKNLPEDKFGNKIMTPEVEALGRKLQEFVMGGGMPAQKSPGEYGVTPKQIKDFADERAKSQTTPSTPKEASGGPRRLASNIPNGRVKSTKAGGTATMTGQTRYKDGKTQFLVVPDGSNRPQWVNQEDVENIESPQAQQGPTLEDLYGMLNREQQAKKSSKYQVEDFENIESPQARRGATLEDLYRRSNREQQAKKSSKYQLLGL